MSSTSSIRRSSLEDRDDDDELARMHAFSFGRRSNDGHEPAIPPAASPTEGVANERADSPVLGFALDMDDIHASMNDPLHFPSPTHTRDPENCLQRSEDTPNEPSESASQSRTRSGSTKSISKPPPLSSLSHKSSTAALSFASDDESVAAPVPRTRNMSARSSCYSGVRNAVYIPDSSPPAVPHTAPVGASQEAELGKRLGELLAALPPSPSPAPLHTPQSSVHSFTLPSSHPDSPYVLSGGALNSSRVYLGSTSQSPVAELKSSQRSSQVYLGGAKDSQSQLDGPPPPVPPKDSPILPHQQILFPPTIPPPLHSPSSSVSLSRGRSPFKNSMKKAKSHNTFNSTSTSSSQSMSPRYFHSPAPSLSNTPDTSPASSELSANGYLDFDEKPRVVEPSDLDDFDGGNRSRWSLSSSHLPIHQPPPSAPLEYVSFSDAQKEEKKTKRSSLAPLGSLLFPNHGNASNVSLSTTTPATSSSPKSEGKGKGGKRKRLYSFITGRATPSTTSTPTSSKPPTPLPPSQHSSSSSVSSSSTPTPSGYGSASASEDDYTTTDDEFDGGDHDPFSGSRFAQSVLPDIIPLSPTSAPLSATSAALPSPPNTASSGGSTVTPSTAATLTFPHLPSPLSQTLQDEKDVVLDISASRSSSPKMLKQSPSLPLLSTAASERTTPYRHSPSPSSPSNYLSIPSTPPSPVPGDDGIELKRRARSSIGLVLSGLTPRRLREQDQQSVFNSTPKKNKRMSTHAAGKKLLVISGLSKEDEDREAFLRVWCETLGSIRTMSQKSNGEVHVEFKKGSVDESASRLQAQVAIKGVGSVHLAWSSLK